MRYVFVMVIALASPALAQSPYDAGYRSGSSAGGYDRWSAPPTPDLTPRSSYEIYDNRWRHAPLYPPATAWQRGYSNGLDDAHAADDEHQRAMDWLSPPKP
jgi:hypothetical protein